MRNFDDIVSPHGVWTVYLKLVSVLILDKETNLAQCEHLVTPNNRERNGRRA
jgi:hypothetical protein